MRRVFTNICLLLPPAFVLFLFVDLLMNPNIPRLGAASPGAASGTLTSEASRELLALSRKLLLQGKDEQALPPALKLYSVYPENYIYSKTLAEIYDRLGRYKEEAVYWEKFMQYAPLPLEGCPNIGQAYWSQKLYKEAIGAYERCLAIDPEYGDSIFFLGHAFELDGNISRAGEIYRQGLVHNPRNMDIRIGMARIDTREGRNLKAKKMILEVLADSPDNVDALLVAGIVAWREGDMAQAKRYLVKGAALTTGYADYHFVLGRIEESQGHIAEAVAYYNRTLEISPDYEDASRRRAALLLRRRR